MKNGKENRKAAWNDALLHVRPEFLEEAARPEALAPLGTPGQNRHPGLRWVLIAAAAVLLVGVMFTASILGNIAWKKYHPVGSAGMVSTEEEGRSTEPPLPTQSPTVTEAPDITITTEPEVTTAPSPCLHLHEGNIKMEQPTCTSSGAIVTYCRDCGEELTRKEYAPTHHMFTEEVLVRYTCTASGAVREKCKECGYETVRVTPPAHRITTSTYRDGCTEPMFSKTWCMECGEVFERTEIAPAENHAFVVVGKGPTCGNPSTYFERCQKCGRQRPYSKEQLPPTGDHVYNEEGVCTGCGKTLCGYYWEENETGYTFLGTDPFFSDSVLEIPAEYQGKPVTAVYFFKYDMSANDYLGFLPSCVTGLVVPDTVKRLECCEFEAWENVSSVVLPEGLEYIGTSFLMNSKITELTIPSTVRRIGSYAFSCCNSLQKLDIRCKDAEIAETAFFGSELYDRMIGWDGPIGLEWGRSFEGGTPYIKGPGTFRESVLHIPDTYRGVPIWHFSDDAFRGCDFLEEVRLPSGLNSAMWLSGAGAFADCTRLKTVILPERDEYADFQPEFFAGCTALETVFLPKNVDMGYSTDIFVGCISLKTIVYGGTRAEWTEMMAKIIRVCRTQPAPMIPEGTVIRCTDGDLIAGASWTDYTWVE